jgi:hypothetical protein
MGFAPGTGQNAKQAGQRRMKPLRPVGQLVLYFVERLIKQEKP